MGRKHYRAYTSYQYLEAGRDYQPFELARELDRVSSTRPPIHARVSHTAVRDASSRVTVVWRPRASMWSLMGS